MPTFPDYDCWHSGEGGGGGVRKRSLQSLDLQKLASLKVTA